MEESLETDLEHHAHRRHRNDGEIGGAVVGDARHRGLKFHEGPGKETAQHGEDHPGAEGQQNSVDRRAVGGLIVLFTQTLGEEGVDTDAGTHCHRDHQVLGRKGQTYGGKGVLADVGDENAVHHVIERLHQHGDHHGQGHGNKETVDGHNAHLVLLGLLIHLWSPRSSASAKIRSTVVFRPMVLLMAKW